MASLSLSERRQLSGALVLKTGIAALKQVSKAGRTPMPPHQDFRDQRDTRRAWLGIIGIDQKCLIAVLDDFDQHSKLMNAENTLRGVWVDMSVACRFEEFFEDSREKTAVERLQNRISVHAEGRKI